MARRKPLQLSVSEHLALADKLATITRDYHMVYRLLEERLPPKFVKKWGKAMNPLLDFKADLEDELIAQLNREGLDDGQSPQVYTGKGQRKDPWQGGRTGAATQLFMNESSENGQFEP